MTIENTKENKKQLKELFLCYYPSLDNHKIMQLSYDIISKECNGSQTNLHNFLEAAISKYNDIPYHNATHGFNALYNGNILLKLMNKPNNERQVKFIFLVCCLLHDIGHPGVICCGHEKIDLENHHAELIKKLLSKFLPEYVTELNIKLIKELILSTNLNLHSELLNTFKYKYLDHKSKNNIEHNSIDLTMLIKIADIGASYKKFDDFMCGSKKLEEEMFGKNTKYTSKRLENNECILINYSLPLAEVFSTVFTDFKFLHEKAIENLRKIKKIQ
ncbi:phosphodiesterase [Vairimorpha necatrix]|uniref:Phosphodiesterase n=1 Tax=Vairimorpha necatrix TaxID=6039 RepID=A0AAX4J9N5_9MICR